ncbi:MAG: helical backbone metal receptor [Proteobacteria bacterium]|nr:helical backbone metal receptor [Pseudomonadota bacterium]
MIKDQPYHIWLVFGMLVILLGLSSHTWAPSANDGLDKRHRVVTLAPHLAEVVFAAGAGEHLIGVISGTDYPVAATKIPVVGGVNGIDFEKLVMLQPTMVLGWEEGNKSADIVKLQSLGIPIRILRSNRLVDIHKQIVEVGDMFGSELTAVANADVILARILKFSLHSSNYHQKKIFVQVWDKPIFTIGRAHLINEGLQLCGATNVGERYPFLASAVSMETVLLSGADYILDLTGNLISERSELDPNRGRSLQAYIPILEGSGDLLMRPGPRFLDGLETLCIQLSTE